MENFGFIAPVPQITFVNTTFVIYKVCMKLFCTKVELLIKQTCVDCSGSLEITFPRFLWEYQLKLCAGWLSNAKEDNTNWLTCDEVNWNDIGGDSIDQLECGTWYHHRDAYSVSWAEIWEFWKSQSDIISYRCRHNLKNNCIWDNLQYCLLGPRSPSKPVMLTFDLQFRKCYSLRSLFGMYNLERQLWYWHLFTRHCPCSSQVDHQK